VKIFLELVVKLMREDSLLIEFVENRLHLSLELGRIISDAHGGLDHVQPIDMMAKALVVGSFKLSGWDFGSLDSISHEVSLTLGKLVE
jgi:hypothetical protein